MMADYVDNIEDVKILRQYGNAVWVQNVDGLDNVSNKIMEYERDNKQYKIVIDFCTDSSLEHKMELV